MRICRKCGLASGPFSTDRARHCEPCKRAAFNAERVRYHHAVKARNPEKYRARKKLNRSISRGWMTKPDCCSRCGAGGRIEGHHADYSKPREVVWLCPPCHRMEHAA